MVVENATEKIYTGIANRLWLEKVVNLKGHTVLDASSLAVIELV